MKNNQLRTLILISACSLGSGCSDNRLDFCSLLSLDEVRELDRSVMSSEMGVRGESTPTHYCIYKNSDQEELFLLSMGNPTKNSPYNILQVYAPFMEGENRVEPIEGVGTSAAALFSDDYETDKFRILIANGDKWSVTIRAKNILSKKSQRFIVLKELADSALLRF